ncbi:MAG: hypothetical protein OCD01_11620 [Fibrobacterales bacterium]
MKALFTATLVSSLALLTSCDRSSETNPAAPIAEAEQPIGPAQLYGARVTSSIETLPTCSPELTALLFYVQSEGTLQYCDGDQYIVISLQNEYKAALPVDKPEPTTYNGVTIYSGEAAPVNTIGAYKDLYFNLSTGDVYEKSESAWAISYNTVGPKGVKGDEGDIGEKGVDGSNGARGLSGLNGSNCSVSETTDSVAVSCDNGTSVNFGKAIDGDVGPQGIQGENGTNGDNGETGADGNDGTSCTIELRNAEQWIVCGDATEVAVPQSMVHTGNISPEEADGNDGDTYIEYAEGHTIYWHKNSDSWLATSLVDNHYSNVVYSPDMMGVNEPGDTLTDTTYIETDSFVRWVKLSTPLDGWAIKYDPDSTYFQDDSQFYATSYENNIFAYKLIVAEAPFNIVDTLYFLENQANPNDYDIKNYYATEDSYNNDSLYIYDKNVWHHSLIENLNQGDTCNYALDQDKYRYSKIEASVLICFDYGTPGQLWTKFVFVSSSI